MFSGEVVYSNLKVDSRSPVGRRSHDHCSGWLKCKAKRDVLHYLAPRLKKEGYGSLAPTGAQVLAWIIHPIGSHGHRVRDGACCGTASLPQEEPVSSTDISAIRVLGTALVTGCGHMGAVPGASGRDYVFEWKARLRTSTLLTEKRG